MYQNKTVGIVFPAYNEEAGIQKAVSEFKSIECVDKVYVINNNSKDKTAELAESAGAIVITETQQGYGHALRRGLKEADTEYIILCEPDGTFVPRDIYKLLSYAYDFVMVMGTRTTRELIWRQANMGYLLRNGNTMVAKFLAVIMNGPSLSDCGCTFRLLHRSLVDRINPHLTVGKSHFLPELVCLALLMRAPIIEIPLNYRGRLGQSKITGSMKGTITTALGMLWVIFKYRFKGWFGFGKKLGDPLLSPSQLDREPHPNPKAPAV